MNRGGLFIGVESFSWSFADFDRAVAFALSLNFSYLVVKVYEITQGDWYQSLGGSSAVIAHIKAQGIDVMPYGYLYGNAAATEITAIKDYLNRFGAFCLDMEGEFDNDEPRMLPYYQSLQGHAGNLYISTWANPLDHNWEANIRLMNPLVKAWQPQVYTPYLASVWLAQWVQAEQSAILNPTFNIWSDGTSPTTWGPWPEFTVWEYQGLVQATMATQQEVKALMPSGLPISPALEKQFDDVWYCKAGLVPAGYQSGIYQGVKHGFFELKYSACFPTSEEINTVDWNGKPLLYQALSNGYHAEYTQDGTTNVYAPTDSLVWSYKP